MAQFTDDDIVLSPEGFQFEGSYDKLRRRDDNLLLRDSC